MSTRIHTTLSGHRIEYDPAPEVEAFLRRLEEMVADATITEQMMIGVAYSRENPMLDQTKHPERGFVTKTVLENPAYDVVKDLLFRKRVAQDSVDVEKIAARYSMTVGEAATELGISESAVRLAIASKRIASWMKGGKHYLEPASVAALEVGTRGPRVRGPLEIVMGHAEGISLKVKSHGDIEPLGRVKGNIVKGRLDEWRRVIVLTTQKGGSKRAFVLDAGGEEAELTHGPFSVHGRFVVKEKANKAVDAEMMWNIYEVA